MHPSPSSGPLFSFIPPPLPSLSQLKEDALAKALLAAFQVDPSTAKGKDVLGWRYSARSVPGGGGGGAAGEPGGGGTGGERSLASGGRSTAGLLADRVRTVLFAIDCDPANDRLLTVGQVNEHLDALAAAPGTTAAKGAALAALIKRASSPRTAFYLVQIILMRLKAGVYDSAVLKAWHPAAQALWNTTSSLKRVCDDLKDPRAAWSGPGAGPPRIELGAPAQPFMARTAPCVGGLADATAAVVAGLAKVGALGGEGGMPAWPPEVAAALASLGSAPSTSAPAPAPPPPPPPHSSLDPARAPPFYIEKKFDGYRIQLHVDRPAGTVRFWTRNAIDHGGQSNFGILGPAVAAQVRPARVVLDGELSVWRLSRRAEEPFNLLRPAWNAAGDASLGLGDSHFCGAEEAASAATADPDWTPPALADLVLLYAPFDVLWLAEAGGCTAHLPLPARKALLAAVVGRLPPGTVGVEVGVEHAPVAGGGGGGGGGGSGSGSRTGARTRMLGRLEPLLAGEPFMCDSAGTPVPHPACLAGSTPADIEAAYRSADERGEEGIVVKGAAAAWSPGERDGGWVKMKPEYERLHEVDALVVGFNYGTGHRGGLASEYVCALLDERPPARDPATGLLPHRPPGAPLPRFATFVRVGTGFTMLERERLDACLQELKAPREGGAEAAGGRHFPPWLRVAGTASEAADQWVADPTHPRTPVLALKADVRVTQTRSYAVGLGLRHVTIARLQEDRCWADIPVARDFLETIRQQKGLLGRSRERGGGGGGDVGGAPAAAALPPRPLARPRGTVPDHLRPTAGLTPAPDGPLAGKSVHVIDRLWGGHYGSAPACQAAVARLGGRWVAGLTPASAVDFVLAADPSAAGGGGVDAIGASLYRAAIAGGPRHPGRDVLDVAWLAECEAAVEHAAAAAAGGGGGMEVDGEARPVHHPALLVAPAPRHYLHLARTSTGAAARAPGDIAAEAHALPDPDRWGDPRTQPSTPADMRAVLSRFMAGVPLTRRDVLGEEGAGGDALIAPGTPDADEAVSAGLAALRPQWPVGTAPLPDTRLRGVAAASAVLPRPPVPAPPKHAPYLAHRAARTVAAAEARTDALARQAAETGLVARGGWCVREAAAWGAGAGAAGAAAPLTHLLVVRPPGMPRDAWPDPASAVLEAVWSVGAAAGLARLRAALAAGLLQVVGEEWVEGGGGGGAAHAAPPGRPGRRHPFPGLPPAGSDAGWPWDRFSVAPVAIGDGPVLGHVGPAAGSVRRRRADGGGGLQPRAACGGGARPRGAAGAAPPRRRWGSPPQPSGGTTLTAPAPTPLPPGTNIFTSLLDGPLSQSGGGRGSRSGGAEAMAARAPQPPPPPPSAPPAPVAAAGPPQHPFSGMMEAMGLPQLPPPPPPAWRVASQRAAAAAAAAGRPSQRPPSQAPALVAVAPPPEPDVRPTHHYPDGAFTAGMPHGWTLAEFRKLPQEEMERLMRM